ncbi:MAG: hypothetical protein IPL08_09500 [Saprospiraceae bacterium]|nr:hypothetical protein [Saprospiraceae bacterium]
MKIIFLDQHGSNSCPVMAICNVSLSICFENNDLTNSISSSLSTPPKRAFRFMYQANAKNKLWPITKFRIKSSIALCASMLAILVFS